MTEARLTQARLTAERWEALLACSDEFTCYSAAVAVWSAMEASDWGLSINTGLWLTITEAADRLLGFAYFRPHLRAELRLVRTGANDPEEAVDGVRAELARSGRVIVAGDGFHLPWHVAYGRGHAPHWYVLLDSGEGLEVADPFGCRNQLGVQTAVRLPVARGWLRTGLSALPGDDPVHRLREMFALGDETTEGLEYRYQWFVRDEVDAWRRPAGADGAAAALRMARYFRDHGQDPEAYAQADDIWSIARHRAFMARRVAAAATERRDEELAAWAGEHAAPLAKRWGHMAPLLMQARLSLTAGRAATDSVPAMLENLAAREAAAADALPAGTDPGRV